MAGRVTVGGKPLRTGHIGFIPDEASGTKHPEYSMGEIQADGTYRLVTNDKAGVRPGWYKIVVWASAEPIPQAPAYGPDGQLAPIRWLVAAKYARKETTDVQVEVRDNAPLGSYDFDFSPP